MNQTLKTYKIDCWHDNERSWSVSKDTIIFPLSMFLDNANTDYESIEQVLNAFADPNERLLLKKLKMQLVIAANYRPFTRIELFMFAGTAKVNPTEYDYANSARNFCSASNLTFIKSWPFFFMPNQWFQYTTENNIYAYKLGLSVVFNTPDEVQPDYNLFGSDEGFYESGLRTYFGIVACDTRTTANLATTLTVFGRSEWSVQAREDPQTLGGLI